MMPAGRQDIIDTPTAAQALALGDRRRRVPVLCDPRFPAGLGGAQDRQAGEFDLGDQAVEQALAAADKDQDIAGADRAYFGEKDWQQLQLIRALARDLGERGYVVVSGLARGIDTAAHEGAL